MTHPDGSTSITEYYRDGRIKKESGTAVADTAYSYEIHPSLTFGTVPYYATATVETRLTSAGGTSEWIKTSYDPLGRPVRVEYPGASAYALYAYFPPAASAGSRWQLQSVTDADGVAVTYAYNAEGKRVSSSRSVPLSGGGTGTRVEGTATDVVATETLRGTAYGPLVRTTTTLNGVTTRVSFRSGDGLMQGSRVFGNEEVSIRTVTNTSGAWTVTHAHADGASDVAAYAKGGLEQTTTFKNSSGGTVSSSSRVTNPLRRLISSTQSRTGTTTYSSHTAAGKARTLTDPGARITSWTLDKWGRTLTVDAPNTVDAASSTLNNVTRYSYYPTGRVKAVWGDQTYASFYVYDEQNRMTALRSYRGLAHNTEPVSGTAGYDQTAWSYDAQRGWLSSKRDAAAKGADYTYTAAGRLAGRQWARTLPSSSTRVTAAYAHTHGYLTGIDYNDSTPDVSVAYDAMGRYHQVARPGHSWVYTYDAASLRLDTETVTCDTNGDNVGDFTRVLDRSWDSLERNTGWQLKQSSTVLHQNGYAYDNAGRISTVSGMTGNYVYGYVANAPALVSGIMGSADTGDLGTPINGNIPVTTYAWEGTRDVLDVMENKIGTSSPATISRYDYTVNAIGQRTAVAQSGSIFGGTPSIGWGYDARGQVQHANHSTNAHDRYYAYDAIGSRLKSREGVAADSGGTLASYTPNALNQYSGITLPGSSAVAPVYDHDGNLAEDKGVNAATQARKFEWDAENQLVAVRRASNNALIASYSYDPFGRRIRRKTESIATGGAGEQLFFYDGWNLAAEFVKSGSSWNMGNRYVWGLDLSGSLQGAGGVGGLLEVTAVNGLRIRAFHDGHGNITSYSNMISGVTAAFQYDAFGKITASSGSPAARFSFSSKLLEPETGYSYYGYRFYDAFTGRWLNRDPIGERGGLNLYTMGENDAVNGIDVLGLACNKIIRVGHASPSLYDKLRRGYPKCDVGIVGCAANNLNQRFLDAGNGIPGMPTNDLADLYDEEEHARNVDRHGPFDRNDYLAANDMAKAVDDAIDAAKKSGEASCGPPDCCKKITIEIKCLDPDANKWESEEARQSPRAAGNPDKKSKCGTKIEINCEKTK